LKTFRDDAAVPSNQFSAQKPPTICPPSHHGRGGTGSAAAAVAAAGETTPGGAAPPLAALSGLGSLERRDTGTTAPTPAPALGGEAWVACETLLVEPRRPIEKPRPPRASASAGTKRTTNATIARLTMVPSPGRTPQDHSVATFKVP
jgi:hypothetical protein